MLLGFTKPTFEYAAFKQYVSSVYPEKADSGEYSGYKLFRFFVDKHV